MVGNFNSEVTESAVEAFCEMYHLHNVIKDSTFFKNPDKPSYSDLILANFSKAFVKSETLENCLLDFQKLTLYLSSNTLRKRKASYSNETKKSFQTNRFGTNFQGLKNCLCAVSIYVLYMQKLMNVYEKCAH